MLMSKNVNNDVSKDSPICTGAGTPEDAKLIFMHFFKQCFNLKKIFKNFKNEKNNKIR